VQQVQSTVSSTLGNSLESTGTTYLTAARIVQPHALLYLIGFALYILTNVAGVITNTFFQRACYGLCCCCFTGKGSSKGLKTFSNDIYKELSVEDLKNEYMKTKTEVNDFLSLVQTVQGKDKTDYELFIKKSEAKLQTIKSLVESRLRESGQEKALYDTMEGFNQLF